MNESIFLLDMHAIVHRLFHVLDANTSKEGKRVEIIFGVVKWLTDFLERERAVFVACCWDAPGRKWRHELFADYKANRKPLDPDLKEQLKEIRQIVPRLGFWCGEVQGFEADDIIATMESTAESDVVIVSADKDLKQLICDNRPSTSMLSPFPDETGVFQRCNETAVIQRYGVGPEQMAEYLAIVGDSSDNIPGIRGLGEKAAVDILNGSTLTKRQQTLLEQGEESRALSRRLVELRRDVPIAWKPSDLVFSLDHAKFAEVLREYGFENLAARHAEQEAEL